MSKYYQKLIILDYTGRNIAYLSDAVRRSYQSIVPIPRKYCKVDVDADWNAAENVLARLNDSEISLWTPYQTVKSILQARIRQSDETVHSGLEL